ncbi:MAG: leucine--tRNA ligase [Acidobacteriota bacterium]
MSEAGYDFKRIEEKWQKYWAENRAFETSEDRTRPKYYCLEMFPYPSGRIHMGHVRNYSIGDVVARLKRMKGFNVLHPMGWDALGMPAENAAIKHGTHPETWTRDNISHMREQLKKMGLAYAWDRELATCDPEYYRWNQYFFIRMFDRGLAYRKGGLVNWCPKCATVLANEQVVGGGCWRCETPVEQRVMEQWFLKITAYAEQLLQDEKLLTNWPEHVLTMQENWIGRSEGARVAFAIDGVGDVTIFTTRLDTIYGATFVALSPEHPFAQGLIEGSPTEAEARQFIAQCAAERMARGEPAEKRGLDTGRKALNPYTGEMVPVFLANFVLMEYGTGAIMAVPAHDERDHEFALKYGLPIRQVIQGPAPNDYAKSAYTGEGVVIASGPFTGLPSDQARTRMAAHAKEREFGEAAVTYKLRDWGISRQRYWGTPIPMIHCDRCGVVPERIENLPVRLPHGVALTGSGDSPLAHVPEFVNTRCPGCGGPGRRETDTMDTFVDSAWYFLRYVSPRFDTAPFDAADVRYWLPVDIYIGGIEHAILHLIYLRFITKFLREEGLVHVAEPIPKLVTQGMVTLGGSAMSKSKGNVVDPDAMVEKYGADALRVFILFAAPPEKDLEWTEHGIEGSYRFLNRINSIVQSTVPLFRAASEVPSGPAARELLRKLHQTIRRVTHDIEVRLHLNTPVASMMEFLNAFDAAAPSVRAEAGGEAALRECVEKLILLLSPFAPHLAEEWWEMTGHQPPIATAAWPSFDEDLAREDQADVIVQVNGKVRGHASCPFGAPEAEVSKLAEADPKVASAIAGKTIVKRVYVPNRLLNIVVR